MKLRIVRSKNIIDSYGKLLFTNRNIIGFAIGEKIVNNINTHRICLTIYVKKKMYKGYLNSNEVIPNYFYGMETDIIESGVFNSSTIKSDIKELGFKGTISGGDSICNLKNKTLFQIPFGTITCAVSNKTNPVDMYLLASQHALITDKEESKGNGVKGDPIAVIYKQYFVTRFQKIASLYQEAPKYRKILPVDYAQLPRNSLMDAAIAKVDLEFKNKIESGLKEGIKITKVKRAEIGQSVFAIGSVSGQIEGRVSGIYGTLITINEKEYSVMSDLTFVDMKSNEGDSGSLGVFKDKDDYYGFGMIVSRGKDKTSFAALDTVVNYFNIDILK